MQITKGKEHLSKRFCTKLEDEAKTPGQVEALIRDFIPTLYVYRSPSRVIAIDNKLPHSVVIVVEYS